MAAESGNGTTKVRFDLWAVLGVIVAASFYGFLYLNSSLAEGRAARIAMDQNLIVRVTTLETQYKYITEGICELKAGQEKLTQAINRRGRGE